MMSNAQSLAKKKQVVEVPSLAELCFEHPLYEEIPIQNEESKDAYIKLLGYNGKFDGYCVKCKKETVWKCIDSILNIDIESSRELLKPRRFTQHFICLRNDAHVATFYFIYVDRILQKIGQYPSLADTAIAELGRYRALLEMDASREFHKALGLRYFKSASLS